jgi:L-alanine-DL-glutamate epimerase-like enolase superfamily enzyme
MKITAIDTFLLTLPYATRGGFHFIAGRPSSGLNMLLVRIRTDAGLEGWGEAFGHAVVHSTKAVIDTMVAPFFLDRDPRDIAALMDEAQRKFHLFGRNGPVIYALSGIDMALWDIAAKAAGLPLYRLLGGTPRRDLPAYSSLLRCTGPDAVAQSVETTAEQGFRHIKLHEIDVPSVRAAREAVGPDLDIMLDTNCPWSVAEAIAMAEALRPFRLYWLEEPVWPPEDHEGLAQVRKAGAVTSAGENIAGLHDFRAMFMAGAVDIVQPSVSKVGGVTEMRKIMALADTFGVRLVPHCGYLGAGFLATLHLTASFAQEELVERLGIAVEGNPFGEWTEVRGGRVAVPQDPGLGCEPDMGLVERYRVA